MDQRRILIVEDDDIIRRAWQRWLRTTSAEIVYATNGEEALQLLREGVYDFILSDVDMPKMNGLRLFACIVSEFPALAMKFAFFTSSLQGPFEMAGIKVPVFDKSEYNAVCTIIAQDLRRAV